MFFLTKLFSLFRTSFVVLYWSYIVLLHNLSIFLLENVNINLCFWCKLLKVIIDCFHRLFISEIYLQVVNLIPGISTHEVDPDTIFANNEMSLRDIEIYGFDYDYTLAFYSSHLHTLIFNIARDLLISNHRVRALEADLDCSNVHSLGGF